MKGVVLAGGLGSRLFPLTKITNKHLLPVYNEPMVYYPIRTLVNAGIREIMLVTGGQNAGEFLRLLENGEAFGLRQLNYAYQVGEGGIAAALRLAEPFADGEPICVILGDQILEKGIGTVVEEFIRKGSGAHIVLKEVPDPNRFGVPVLENGRIVRIEEKPPRPASPYAVIGVYFYDTTVFDRIARLVPSGRGELEVTDLNNSYLAEGQLGHSILDGWWADAGTFESLMQASNLVAQSLARQAGSTTAPAAGSARKALLASD